MSEPFRLPTGGRVDRARPVYFTFDGRPCTGLHGDTLASALLANDVHLVGRSFKYHRPRGIFTAGSEEPNALVTVSPGTARHTPNGRATQLEICDGLVVESQNRYPSLARDFGAINDHLAPLLPAGFYYKTFKWPRSFWKHLYEPAIRRLAGLGRAPADPDPDCYTNRHAHCDVLVVGAGPAGLAAALAASAGGARVILCDEQQEPGGSLLAETTATIAEQPAWSWLASVIEDLNGRDNVRILPRTTAFGYFADNFVGLVERLADHRADAEACLIRERLWQVRARRVVLATGASERPLVFPDNDRPGIMLADAARSFVNRYAVRPGLRAIVATAHDGAYRAALDLHAAGIEIALIADLRPVVGGNGPQAARRAGLRVEAGASILGTTGRLRVRRARIHLFDRTEAIACDLLLTCGGFAPRAHLFSQSGGKLVWREASRDFVPGEPAQDTQLAGACAGTNGLQACMEEGACAGEEAARAVGKTGSWPRASVSAAEFSSETPAASPIPFSHHAQTGKAFVDLQNDVTVKDLLLANREGFRSIEHVKRYTTAGMGTDQGKTSSVNAIEIVARNLTRAVPDIGFTTFRPPYTPVTFGALAGLARGELFDPVRTTPIHDWAQAHGAVFEDVGRWKRARYFPHAGEDMHAAVARECQAVRSRAGLLDASTLGKIEVVGPDAAAFLDRIYVNAIGTLSPGRARYCVMLKEDGFILDDGIVARLAPDRFHVTTTTGGAARVLAHMEDYLQTEWPDLKTWLTSTTEQWAVIAVAGPLSRELLAPLVEDIDVSPEALPHMSLREGRICGIPARLFRVSFSGELGFEVNVPADFGRAVWEAIWTAGQAHGIAAYGTETMHVLRADKGYFIVGQETDGSVTLDDLGLARMISSAKGDFVGKRSLARADMVRSDRKQLVGLLTADPNIVLDEGGQVTEQRKPRRGAAALGHVTSSYWSAALGRSIALALVAGGRARLDGRIHVQALGRAVTAKVTSPIFHDPANERIHA